LRTSEGFDEHDDFEALNLLLGISTNLKLPTAVFLDPGDWEATAADSDVPETT